MALALGAVFLSAAGATADASPDMSYCWPTVVVQDEQGKLPLWGSAQLYRIEPGSVDTVRWVSGAGLAIALGNGRTEIAGVPAGRYLVWVYGVFGERPLAEWEPPPGRPTRPLGSEQGVEVALEEIAVGVDPWKRPVQAQGYEAWAEWNIVYGNCADWLVVTAKPGPWVTQTGERRILVPQFPSPYRPDYERKGESRPLKP